jgi:hypothetical protein
MSHSSLQRITYFLFQQKMNSEALRRKLAVRLSNHVSNGFQLKLLEDILRICEKDLFV